MAKKSISIHKELYKKVDIDTLIDTEFRTFVKPVEEIDTDTVEELFRLYDKLFYSIPTEGETNSHQYLLQKSSEVATFDRFTDEIQPLLDEISQLRRQILANDQLQFELESSEDIINN